MDINIDCVGPSVTVKKTPAVFVSKSNDPETFVSSVRALLSHARSWRCTTPGLPLTHAGWQSGQQCMPAEQQPAPYLHARSWCCSEGSLHLAGGCMRMDCTLAWHGACLLITAHTQLLASCRKANQHPGMPGPQLLTLLVLLQFCSISSTLEDKISDTYSKNITFSKDKVTTTEVLFVFDRDRCVPPLLPAKA